MIALTDSFQHSPVFKDVDMIYTPILLGGIMKETGNKPPLEVKSQSHSFLESSLDTHQLTRPQRNRQRQMDPPGVATLGPLIRRAHGSRSTSRVPIEHAWCESTPPSAPTIHTTSRSVFFCFLTDLSSQAQRALTALSLTHPHLFLPTLDALYNATWGPPRNAAEIHTPAGLLHVLSETLDADVAKEVMTNVEAKGKLAEATKEALGKGAFGVPWWVATNGEGREEGYWGVVSLGQVCEFLGLERTGLKGGGRAVL